MPPRTASRSANTRDKASSPPKSSSGRQRHSPQQLRRSTRSQSRELGGSVDEGSKTKGAQRKLREGSAGSAQSNESRASRETRSRPNDRSANPVPRDLSIVVEDREMEDSEDQDDVSDAVADVPVEEEAGTKVQRGQSPGGLSQMSGTTAQSSFTAVTSHSTQQVSNLDPLLAEFFPDLWESSKKLLKWLAPRDITPEGMERVVRELKIHSSRRCKHVRIEESVFESRRSSFTPNDTYINLSYILRALFSTDNAIDEDCRPDGIVQASNLAHLMRKFTVLQRESPEASNDLNLLDMNYPMAFVSKFDGSPQRGSSALLEDFLKVGLEIRTQATIVSLALLQYRDDFDPVEILTSNFYSAPVGTNLPPKFEDLVRGVAPKPILHVENPAGHSYDDKIRERVLVIRSTFRSGSEAIRNRDQVDFDELHERFPWQEFQWHLAHLARLRYEEILQLLKRQGGIEHIQENLIEYLQKREVEVHYSPASSQHHATKSQPEPDKDIATTQSLFADGASKSILRNLYKMRQSTSSSAPQQTAGRSSTPMATASNNFKHHSTMTARQMTEDEDIVLDDGGTHDEGSEKSPDRASSDYIAAWEQLNNEKNKENRPVQKEKFRLLDRQPDARRVPWESQVPESDGSSPKRSHQEMDEDAVSVDGGFQTDQRIPDPAKRIAAPVTAQLRMGNDRPPAQKRARIEHQEVEDDSRARASTVRYPQQPNASQYHSYARNDVQEDFEEIDDDPPPTAAQISIVARTNTQRAKLLEAPRYGQRRVKWSDADTEYLIEGIERFGCAWSTIHKMPDWEHQRDQVALKDKARNLKVSFLKAHMVLPVNFDAVSLGRKEIEAVRTVIHDYEP